MVSTSSTENPGGIENTKTLMLFNVLIGSSVVIWVPWSSIFTSRSRNIKSAVLHSSPKYLCSASLLLSRIWAKSSSVS